MGGGPSYLSLVCLSLFFRAFTVDRNLFGFLDYASIIPAAYFSDLFSLILTLFRVLLMKICLGVLMLVISHWLFRIIVDYSKQVDYSILNN